MKKIIILLTVLLLVVGLTAISGCGASDTSPVYEIAAPGTWTDGVYMQTARGKNGSFAVTVVITDGWMSSVTVGDHQETPDRGGVAIAVLPGEILEAQSYEVDAISGATVTSQGICQAVARCLEQASGSQ